MKVKDREEKDANIEIPNKELIFRWKTKMTIKNFSTYIKIKIANEFRNYFVSFRFLSINGNVWEKYLSTRVYLKKLTV